MNVDLNKRAFYVTDTDDLISEYSYTYVQPDGSAILIPGVVDGTVLSEPQARELFNQTGQHLGVFSTSKDADRFAQNLSRDRGEQGAKRRQKGESFKRVHGQENLTRMQQEQKRYRQQEERSKTV